MDARLLLPPLLLLPLVRATFSAIRMSSSFTCRLQSTINLICERYPAEGESSCDSGVKLRPADVTNPCDEEGREGEAGLRISSGELELPFAAGTPSNRIFLRDIAGREGRSERRSDERARAQRWSAARFPSPVHGAQLAHLESQSLHRGAAAQWRRSRWLESTVLRALHHESTHSGAQRGALRRCGRTQRTDAAV